MVQRRRLKLNPGAWLKGIPPYGNLALWQDIWHQGQRFHWSTTATEVSFLWLLGLLGSSFGLLQVSRQNVFWVPQGVLRLAHGLRDTLAIPVPVEAGSGLGQLALLAIAIGTGLCLVTGTERLAQVVATAYQGAPSRRRGWAGRLWPWLMAVILLVMVALVAELVGRPLALDTAEGSAPSPLVSWAKLTQGLRWLGAAGVMTLGLGLFNRLSPRPWQPGSPLWPGVGLTLGLGLGLWGLGQWGIERLQSAELAYSLLLELGLSLLLLFCLIVLVPVGAQFNASMGQHGGGPGRFFGDPRITPPPPSFESFKIRR
ncbi:MAG: hypothetical protein ACFCVD_05065 [Nodosilinea sp.]